MLLDIYHRKNRVKLIFFAITSRDGHVFLPIISTIKKVTVLGAICYYGYMDPSDVPSDQKSAENNSPDFQPIRDSFDNPTTPRMEQSPYVTDKKKSSPLKTAKIILGVVIAVPLVVVLIIIVTINSYSSDHKSQLEKLKKETTSLFQNSGLSAEEYDCHDVEFRNQCYFKISEPSTNVVGYLQRQGFSKTDTYGDGYKKGELYVIDNNGGKYTSYYMSDK